MVRLKNALASFRVRVSIINYLSELREINRFSRHVYGLNYLLFRSGRELPNPARSELRRRDRFKIAPGQNTQD